MARRARATAETKVQSSERTPPWPGLLALFGGAWFVRFIYLLEIRSNPTFAHPTADPLLYHERAFEILAGDLVGRGVFFHSSPLYPYFLAASYALTGESIFWTYAIQAAVDAATVALLWLLAARLLDRAIAWTAALVAAFYQAFIFFTGEMLEITLVLFFAILSIWFLVRDADRTAEAERGTRPAGAGRTGAGAGGVALLLGGMALGVAALGKPNVLATVPFLVAGWKWQSQRTWRGTLRPFLVFGAGVALVVLPLTVRNIVVADDLTLTTSNGGINFYIGNHAGAEGIFRVDPEMEADLEGASTRIAETAVGRSLQPSEVSSYWFERGLRDLLADPADALALYARKLLLTFNWYEIPNHFDLSFFERYSALLRFTPMRFGVMVPFAVAGMVVLWPQRRRLAVLYLWVGSYLGTVLLFFVTARYRLPVVPIFCLFAAAAAVTAFRWIRRRGPDLSRGALARLAIGGVAGAIVVHLSFYQPEDFYAHQFGAIGSVYKNQQSYALAAENYRKAVEYGPSGVLFRNNLGVCLLALGEREEGERMIRSALALDPDYAPALRNLGRILEGAGRADEAVEQYAAAFTADPTLTEAGVDLGRMLAQSGELERSEQAFRRVLAQDPSHRSALWNLAVLLGTRMERPEDALTLLDRLLALEPDHPRARELVAFLSER